MRLQPFYKRLEFRVALITVISTITIAVLMYIVVYAREYDAVLKEIRERCDLVYNYLSEELDAGSFSRVYTESGDSFRYSEPDLKQVRRISGLKLLFACGLGANGEIIYTLNGLDEDDPNFRLPGGQVDSGLAEKLSPCFEGQNVISRDMEETGSGYVLAAYYPFYDESGGVIGAVGMEYDCDEEYYTFYNIRLYSIVILLLTNIIVLIISHFALEKLSDPFFRKLAYTDFLTGLRNRTAFEMDIQEYELVKDELESVSFLVFDLNNLKKVNDTLGHDYGDEYIRIAAELIRGAVYKYGDPYRIGGDEFAAILVDLSQDTLDGIFLEFREEQAKVDTKSLKFTPSVSFGRATYRPTEHRNLHDVFVEADGRMYTMKRGRQ